MNAEHGIVDPAWPEAEGSPAAELRRLLLLRIGPLDVALAVERLDEIVPPAAITRAPGMPSWVLGAMNLRGKALPVIDLAAKLGLDGAGEPGDRECILVFDHAVPSRDGATQIGARVAAVRSFVEAPTADLAPPPRLGGPLPSDLLEGLLRVDDRFVPILLVDRAIALSGDTERSREVAGEDSAAPPPGGVP